MDVSIDRIRSDFQLIFDLHKTTVQRIRDSNPEAGDFFSVDEANTTTTTDIEISIQGTPDAIQRLRQGVTIPKGRLHCYVLYTTEILPTDIIQIGTLKFKINNLNDGIKSGLSGFKEFDLMSVKGVES